jgi:hypothetical protein
MMAAGHVVVVGIVCLLVGSFLNASGIRKTALGQPVGLKRDIATFFADPLYDLSHTLYLDRLRYEIQDAAGRGGDDDVDLTLPSPTTTNPTAPTTTTEPRQAFTPARRLRLWIGGDSLAKTPGESIINAAGLLGVVEVPGGGVDYRVATGLARPEVYNWPAHLLEVKNTQNPDAFLLTIGPNDDQSLTGEGGTGPFGSPEWEAEYRRRVGGLLDALTGDHQHKVFLIGAPIIRDVERSETRYKLINNIYKTEAEKRPGLVYYVDIYRMFQTPEGGYTDYLTNSDGSVVQVRELSDGIHFTRAGGDRIAEKVVAQMMKVYDLTSWQKAVTTTTGPGRTPRSPGTSGEANTQGQ